MKDIEQLLAHTHPEAAKPGEHVLSLSSSTPEHIARMVVVDAFGTDETRRALRLIVDGKDRGVLSRSAARNLVLTDARGGFGTGDYATMPGVSPHFTILLLTCPQPGCRTTATSLSYDEDRPPRCPIHHRPLIRAG